VDEELAWNSADKRLEATVSGFYYRKLLVHRAGAPRWRAFNPLYHDQGYNIGVRFKPTDKATLTLDAAFDRHHYLYDFYNRYIDEYYRPAIVDGEPVRVPIHTVYFPGDRSSESDQRRWTVHGKGVFRPGEKHTLSSGVEWIRDALIAPQRMVTDRASTHALAIYGQDEWNPSKNWNLTAGVRVVNHRSFGWTATPKISALHRVGGWNLRATYSRGFKAPTVKELHYFYERAMMGKLRLYVGNTALRPETSHYFSAGPEYHGKNFSFSLTGSYNRVGNMIALVAVPIPAEYISDEGSEYDGAMQYVNMEDARLVSAEMTFSWRPGGGFSVGGGYSWLHTTANLVDAEASEQAGHTIIERRPVDGSATHRANVRIGWRRDWKRYGLDAGLFGRGQTERYYKEYGNAPGYVMWRLNTTHRVVENKGWKLELSAGIDNIFNHRETHPYGYNYGTTSAGRTYFGAVSVKFNSKKQH
jgi:outer membrane receptor for ferrienterochelin and colicins